MTQPEVQNFVYRLYVVSQNTFKRLSLWDWERKTIHIAVMDRLVSGHIRDLIKPLEGTQKALWALQGPSKGFMKPFKRPLGTPFLGGKRRATLGKRALSDSLFGLSQR